MSALSAHRLLLHTLAYGCLGVTQPPSTAQPPWLNTTRHGQPLESYSTIRRTDHTRINTARAEPLDKFEQTLLGFPLQQRPALRNDLPAIKVIDDRLPAECPKANGIRRRSVDTVRHRAEPLGL